MSFKQYKHIETGSVNVLQKKLEAQKIKGVLKNHKGRMISYQGVKVVENNSMPIDAVMFIDQNGKATHLFKVK